MGWLFLLTGLALLAVAVPIYVTAGAPARDNLIMDLEQQLNRVNRHKEQLEQQLEERREEKEVLEEQLALVTESIDALGRKLDSWEKTVHKGMAQLQQASFAEQLEQAGQMSLYDGIYQAADAGKSIVEIAREFERGKGEIELILSLRK